MHARNDALITGPAFYAALRRIFPGRRVLRGAMTIGPAGPGMVCLAYGPPQEAVPAAGTWSEVVAVSAALLRQGGARPAA